jgi:hypothetical protein
MRGRDVPAAISAAADFAIRDEADPGHPAARELGADSKSPARRSIGGNRQTWPTAVIRNRPLYEETAYYNAVRNRWFGLGDYATDQPGR